MKKIFTLVLLAVSSHALAQHDIYVYQTDLYTPVIQAASIQRIEFGETGIQVVTQDGETQSASYDSFDYFRFYATPNPMGIHALTGKSATQRSVYSLTGVEQEATSKMPAGVYIIKEKTDGQETIRKILKK